MDSTRDETVLEDEEKVETQVDSIDSQELIEPFKEGEGSLISKK